MAEVECEWTARRAGARPTRTLPTVRSQMSADRHRMLSNAERVYGQVLEYPGLSPEAQRVARRRLETVRASLVNDTRWPTAHGVEVATGSRDAGMITSLVCGCGTLRNKSSMCSASSRTLGDFRVDLTQSLGSAIEGVPFTPSLERRVGKRRAVCVVVEESADRCCEACWIAGGNQHRVLAIAENVGRPTDGCRDDRARGVHVFEDCDWSALVV